MHWSPHSCCWGMCELMFMCLHCDVTRRTRTRFILNIIALCSEQWSVQLQQGFTSYKYLQGFTIYLQICWKLGNWREDLIFWHCVGVLAGELQKCRLEVSEYGIAFTFCFNFYVNLATLTSPCVTWWLNFHLKLITEHLGWGNLHNIFRV